MTNKLVVIVTSLKVPKIKKILLYEMKFLIPNYSCLQNPWLGGYCPQIPVLSVLCPQLNLLNPSPRTKFLGTPLQIDEPSRHLASLQTPIQCSNHRTPFTAECVISWFALAPYFKLRYTKIMTQQIPRKYSIHYTWTGLTCFTIGSGCCEHSYEHLGSRKCRKYLD